MEYILFLSAFIFLPLFPISLVINRYLFALKTKKLFFAQTFCLIAGSLSLHATSIAKNSMTLSILASLSMLLYAYRLLSVDHLKDFALYLFTLLSSFAWIWYLQGGNMLHFLLIQIPPFIAFSLLAISLYERFVVVHRYSVNGLGNVKPYFSILFVITLFTLTFTPLFAAGVFFHNRFAVTLLHVVILGLAWLFLNWSIVRLLTWLVFSTPSRHLQYQKLTLKEISLVIFFLVLSVFVFSIFAAKGAL